MSKCVFWLLVTVGFLGFSGETGGAVVETITVPSSQFAPTWSLSTLATGQSYVFEVSGVYDYDTWDNHYADAEWKDQDGALPWVEYYDPTYGGNALDLFVNGAAVDWMGSPDAAITDASVFSTHTFSPTHVYRYVFIGTGQKVSFGVFDGLYDDARYTDNGGSLTVKIMQQPVPVPGALLLGGIGMSFVGWLRRHRVL
jgi:hypothetical protein